MKDADKTLRPDANSDKTLRPDNVSDDKTLRPDSVQSDKTVRPGKQYGATKIANQRFDEYELNKIKYKTVRIISEDSGESQIFLVENNKKQFVLKLYFPELNPSPNHSIMEIVKKSAKTDFLVKTFDHGVWTNPKTQEKCDYELMEYCAGGSLDQIKINGNEKLLGEIAIRCASALNLLHKKQIIHNDVKPGNFFFRENDQNIENLALADFGISVQTDKDGKANIDYQVRTKIYTAPETYTNNIEGKIEISYKSDFFSLGIMLLTLWNGEEILKIGERDLNKWKQFGKLPYPKNIGDRTLQLIKALTLPDNDARAGYAEIERWAKGEDIYDLQSGSDEIRKFRVVFNPTKKQIAKSPEELAQFMIEDSELAIRYLYSGKVSQWLKDNDRNDLELDVEDIVEKKYPMDKTAGLFATCYYLDGNMPFYDVNNNALSSEQDIAKSLRDNFEYYEKELEYSEHSLFLYFNARGAENVTQEFAPLFNQHGNNRDALLQLIHTLDQKLPWIIVTEDKKTIKCKTPDDVINARYSYLFSVESFADLCGEGFLTWLRYTDPVIEGKVRSIKDYKYNSIAVLYNLNPKVSYNFQLDENADDYFFTAEDIGRYMNILLEKYAIDKDEITYNQLSLMQNIDDSPLYDYFKSKGSYDSKIEWLQLCANIHLKNNANKTMTRPCNWRIGAYVAIKGLGYNPSYYFPKSDKRVYSLDELNKIPEKEIRDEMKSGYLQDWLTTFYHEDPYLAQTKDKYAFEKKTIEYLGHLEKFDKDNAYVKKFHEGKNSIKNALAEPIRKRRFYIFSKIVVGLLTLIASAAVVFVWFPILLDTPFITGTDAIKFMTFLGAIIGAIIAFFFVGFIGGLIAGGIVAAIIYFFLAPFMLYILAIIGVGLFVFALGRFLLKCYIEDSSNSNQYKRLKSPTFEELELDPLHFSFSNEMQFKSSIEGYSYGYVSSLTNGTKKLYKGLIFPWVLMLVLGILPCIAAFAKEDRIISTVATNYVNGMTAVKSGTLLNRKWGFIDKSGKEVIPNIYSDFFSFSEGLAAAKKDKWGFIDKNCKEIVPFKYDEVKSFLDGMAAVKYGSKWGFIDKKGKQILPFKYDAAISHLNGRAQVKIGINSKWVIIDRQGKVIHKF